VPGSGGVVNNFYITVDGRNVADDHALAKEIAVEVDGILARQYSGRLARDGDPIRVGR
jgi:hypothetical protein